jgi:23S rRNA pseudouridine2605 synthase
MAENSRPKGDSPAGERIAKVLSRRGVSSRREAERLIEAGEVKVNGKIITSPALNVTDADKITISGHPLPALEPARLWLYYKPEGLVTSASDEKGRDTVFDHLPDDMPRVMSVGRLDLNSEGLLLLTNDGELKRRLELPSTGWLRKYRVRIKGNPTDPELEPLRKGVVIDGERFQPMSVVLDRHQGANSWLTIGLREGKNREIRRAIDSIGLIVNRLIRISYGPFRLGELKPGEVEEVRAKVLQDQLGSGVTDDGTEPAARKARPATRRVRPGDAVKALAKAWDEATAAKEVLSTTTTRRAAATRTATTRSVTRSDDEAPRRSAKPAAPRRDRDEAAAPARRSFSTKPAGRSDDSRSPARGGAAKSPGPRPAGAKSATAKPFEPRSPRPETEAPATRRTAAPKRATAEGGARHSGGPKIAGPKTTGPKIASPKIAGPKGGGPRKPPAKPTKR